MDTYLLRVYQEQVVYSCKAVLLGAEDITIGLQQADPLRDETGRLWYGVQNLIIGAGNLSKTLWGSGTNRKDRERRYAERNDGRRDLLGERTQHSIRCR